MQYSSEILDMFGAPELSELRDCGAKDLPAFPDYMPAAIYNYIAGLTPRDPALCHLSATFLRRAISAAEEYSMGRASLLSYVEGLHVHEHRLKAYLSALRHFEQAVSCLWQAATVFNRMEHKLLGSAAPGMTLYIRGSNSDLERVNALANIIKHFSADQAADASAPVWITNEGLESAVANLSFDELLNNLNALSEVARQTFVEIPNQAVARKKATS